MAFVFITIFFNHRSLKSLCIDWFFYMCNVLKSTHHTSPHIQINEMKTDMYCVPVDASDAVVCQSKCKGEIGRKSIFGDYIFQPWKVPSIWFYGNFLMFSYTHSREMKSICGNHTICRIIDREYAWADEVAAMNHTQIIDFILFGVLFFCQKFHSGGELMDDLAMNHLHRYSVWTLH